TINTFPCCTYPKLAVTCNYDGREVLIRQHPVDLVSCDMLFGCTFNPRQARTVRCQPDITLCIFSQTSHITVDYKLTLGKAFIVLKFLLVAIKQKHTIDRKSTRLNSSH